MFWYRQIINFAKTKPTIRTVNLILSTKKGLPAIVIVFAGIDLWRLLKSINYPTRSSAATLRAFLPLRVGGVCGADGERAGVRCSFHYLWEGKTPCHKMIVHNFS
jgi:hypothetical protein